MATYPASSASRADVVTAIGLASDNDTVTIPSGTETWSSQIPVTNEIAIIGNGIGNTVITDYGFVMDDGVDNWRVSGIEFAQGATPLVCMNVGTYHDAVGCHGWRIDNCEFRNYGDNGSSGRPMEIQGYCTGLIDNCTFESGDSAGSEGIRISGGAGAWSSATGLGTDNFVFIEDCVFDTVGNDINHWIIAQDGARFVVRYCTLQETDNGNNGAGIDMHGYGQAPNAPPNQQRGTRAYEIYENTFTKAAAGYGRAMFVRSGTGVIYNNVYDETLDSWDAYIEFREYRLDTDALGPAAIFQWAYNTTYSAWYTGEWDEFGGASGGTAYDMIGRGIDLGAGVGNGDQQADEPLYIWGNEDHLSNPLNTTSLGIGMDADFITENVDYVVGSALGGYSAYTYPHPLRDSAKLVMIRL